MDVLSGALTGSSVGTGVHGPYEAGERSGCGHLFLALDVDAFGGDRAGYEDRVRSLVDEMKSVPLAQGFDEVFYPGEVEDRAEAANVAAGGVVLADQSLADLHRLADETGVPFPVEGDR
jgi:LDH2 family malate/lactate/ureidoglycolate dehydrogenase